MVIKFLEQFVLDRPGARAAGPLRRRRRVLLRPARLPVGRVDPGEGADDLGPDPAAAGRAAAGLRPSQAAERLGKRFARLRDSLDGDGRHARGRARPRDRRRRGRVLLSVIDPDELRQTLADVLRRGRVPLAARAPRRLEALRGEPVHRSRASPAPGSTTSRPSRPRPCSAATRTGAARSGCRSTTSRSASSSSTTTSSATTFTVEYPTGSGQEHTFGEIAQDLADRIVSIWLPGADGRRPVYGGTRAAPDGPGLEGQPLLQRVLPRRQRRRPRRDAPDRLDRARRRPDPRSSTAGRRGARRVPGTVTGVTEPGLLFEPGS